MTDDDVVNGVDPTPAIEPDGKAPWHEPRILRTWASAELAIACVFLVVIVVSVLWQVLSRYVPSINWPGVGELGTYSLITLTFVMVGYLIGKNGHISIQIIDYLVKGRAFVAVKALSAACVALICALLAREAYDLMLTFSTRRTSALELPYWILYLFPLLGFASGVVRAIIRIFTANREDPIFDAAAAK